MKEQDPGTIKTLQKMVKQKVIDFIKCEETRVQLVIQTNIRLIHGCLLYMEPKEFFQIKNLLDMEVVNKQEVFSINIFKDSVESLKEKMSKVRE
jgi:predicted nucleic acid-binding protein